MRLEKRVPPLLLALVVLALMWVVAWLAPALRFSLPGRVPLAVILAVAGVGIVLAAGASFRRAGTTVNPMNPDAASAVVTAGVYRFSRNPMYLGVLLVLAGWGVYLASALALLFLPAFVLYMNRFQIEPEERALERRFGADYTNYMKRVRRWL